MTSFQPIVFRSHLSILKFQVRECMPKLSKLPTLLEASSFKGLEYESLIDPKSLYNWDRLRSEVQASDSELENALPEYLIACIDGELSMFY